MFYRSAFANGVLLVVGCVEPTQHNLGTDDPTSTSGEPTTGSDSSMSGSTEASGEETDASMPTSETPGTSEGTSEGDAPPTITAFTLDGSARPRTVTSLRRLVARSPCAGRHADLVHEPRHGLGTRHPSDQQHRYRPGRRGLCRGMARSLRDRRLGSSDALGRARRALIREMERKRVAPPMEADPFVTSEAAQVALQILSN